MTQTYSKSVLILMLLITSFATAKETARVVRVKDGDTYVLEKEIQILLFD
jgi:hypothetical protein